MSSILYSLGKWAYQARKLVLIIWLAILVLAGGLAATLTQGLDNSISIPGTESQEALDQLRQTFPEVSGTSARIVVVAPEGEPVTADTTKKAIASAVAELADLDQVDNVPDPFDKSLVDLVSENDRAALINVQLAEDAFSITDDTKTALANITANLKTKLPSDYQIALGGELFSQNIPGISLTELIGVMVALLVLIINFGSLLAAGLPLAGALLGVAISTALIFFATVFGPITSTTPLLSLMLGIAVGIDYALFIISRHQDQVRSGMDPKESTGQALATSGSAVIFAGLTVIIALLGLSVAGIPFLSVMGYWAAIAVALAVLVSITLTPALLGFVGNRIVPKRARKATAAKTAAAEIKKQQSLLPDSDAAAQGKTSTGNRKPNRFFLGWVRAVTKWPVATILLVVAALGALSIPAFGLKLALPDAGGLPQGNDARIAYDLVSEHYGEGFNGPLIVTGTIVTSTDPLGLMDDLAAEIKKLPGVAAVPLATPNMTADTGIVQVVPEGAPDSEQTKELVHAIRNQHDYFLDTYSIDISVTGFTAVGIDVSEKLGAAMLPFGLIVVGLSLVLLAIVFRSIWVPIKATIGYILTIGSAFGVVNLVFGNGFMADLLHVAKTGPVISFIPIILMGVLFGLAMDYEMFLVSRMREHYVHSGNAKQSVIDGFTDSAKVVTAAAIIMFAVFVAFVPEGDVNIKPIALGLAVGVFVDAFIVRMALVPAILTLLRDHAWWMPKWLDKLLPHFDVEGEGMQKQLELQNWPENAAELSIACENIRLTAGDNVLYENLSFQMPKTRNLLVSGQAATVTALLLTVSGRLDSSGGKLKVLDYALPMQNLQLRKHCYYLSGGDNARSHLNRAIAERAKLVIFDEFQLLPDSDLKFTKSLIRTAVENNIQFIFGASSLDDVQDFLPTGIKFDHLDLHNTTKLATKTAKA